MGTTIPLILTVRRVYTSRCFNVLYMSADNAFAPIREDPAFILSDMNLNITSVDEHTPFIERCNCTLKERCRMTFATTTFLLIPRCMTVELVYSQLFWLICFIPTDYVFSTSGHATMMSGRTYDYNLLCRYGSQFGKYVQTHEATDNTMKLQTVGAINLCPSRSFQYSFYYYIFITGHRLHHRRATTIPIPAEIIARVQDIATKKCLSGLTFLPHNNLPFIDEDTPLTIPNGSINHYHDTSAGVTEENRLNNDDTTDTATEFTDVIEYELNGNNDNPVFDDAVKGDPVEMVGVISE